MEQLTDEAAKTKRKLTMGKKPKQPAEKSHDAICASCERLPIWLREWPAEVTTQLWAGTSPERMKVTARSLWQRYGDRVVDAVASEIRGACRRKYVRGLRKSKTPPWYEQREIDVTLICKLCGGEIQDNPADPNGRCHNCGQRYWFGQPDRPELTEVQWAVMTAHAASEGRCQPDGKVTTRAE